MSYHEAVNNRPPQREAAFAFTNVLQKYPEVRTVASLAGDANIGRRLKVMEELVGAASGYFINHPNPHTDLQKNYFF